MADNGGVQPRLDKSSLVVRDAVDSDLDPLLETINTAYRTTASWTHEVGSPRTHREEMQSILDHAKTSKSRILVLTSQATGTKILGTIKLAAYEPSPFARVVASSSKVILGMFAVHPGFQSMGLGTLMIRRSIEAAREAGYEEAIVWVLEMRREIMEWYQRLGFKPTGARFQYEDPTVEVDVAMLVELSYPLKPDH
eukprot:jgi/Hompol1/1014/HPOL_002631-RA